MWDEQERFAKAVSKIFTCLLAVVGVVIAVLSLASGIPDCFFGFLLLLGALAAILLGYGVAAVSLRGLLLGITGGAAYCFRWLTNHRFSGRADR